MNTSSKNIVNNRGNPLHVAAALGDIASLETCLSFENDYDIDARDDLNLTPLQIAALSGHTQAVKLLIAKGADVLAQDGYDQNFSALHLAVWQGHPDIVNMLIEVQKKGDLLPPSELFFPLLYSLEHVFFLMQQPNSDPQLLQNALDVFFILMNSEQLPLLDFASHDEFYDLFSDPTIPVLVSLEALTRYAPSREIYDQIMSKIMEFTIQDSCYQTYVDTRCLLHVFPINRLYCTVLYETPQGQQYEYFMSPEGFMACFSTPFISDQIDFYQNSLTENEPLALGAFTDLSEIYHQGIVFSKEQGIFENAQLAYNLYNNGQTLLLATGWEGHAVNVVLDPIHEYFIVANSGERYENFGSGAYVYKIHNPDNVTPQLIFNILNNTDQVDLELTYRYKLALDKVDFLEHPEQQYGNCAVYSHNPTIEALLYIHFLNEGSDKVAAKLLAHEHYLGWEAYEHFHCLQMYFDHNPTLDIHSVLDILIDYHPSLFSESQEGIDFQEYQQAKYLVDILATDQYRSDYEDCFWELPQAKPELIDLFKSVDLPFSFDDVFDHPEPIDMDRYHPWIENQPVHFDSASLLDGFCLQQLEAL